MRRKRTARWRILGCRKARKLLLSPTMRWNITDKLSDRTRTKVNMSPNVLFSLIVGVGLLTINVFSADMFPSAKRRKGPSPGRPVRKERTGKYPQQTASRRHESRDNTGKGWKKSRDGDKLSKKKMKFGGKTFGAKRAGDGEKKFGKKRFDGNQKDKSFKSKFLKAKAGFKKKGTGAKQGFKHKKGKG